MSKRRLALVTAVAALAAFGLAGCSPKGYPVTVLRGKSTGPNAEKTAISFNGKRVGGPKFDFIDVDGPWVVAGALWWDGTSWHDSGDAPCLDDGRSIELGVVEAAAYKDAPGRGAVVWLKCL